MPDAVTFTYTNWRGEVANRRVRPFRIKFEATAWHPEPQWLLVAYDLDKRAERDFAIKDIGGWRPLEPETGGGR